MEPNSLIFLTLISKLQSRTVAICLSTKYPWRPFPESKPLDCIECKILTHCRSSINPPPPLRMRPQSPPFLLKKNENCRKIIKVPLHGHETFGAIHTIQYRCIKYCSRCRRRGYYNGLNRAWSLFQASGTWKGRGFYSWSIWKGPKWDQSQMHFMDVRYKKTCISHLFIL